MPDLLSDRQYNLRGVFDHLREQDPALFNSVNDIELRVAALYPKVRWQCIAKFVDRRHAWSVAVADDPGEALLVCLHTALRGPEAAKKTEANAIFHLSRKMAMAVAEMMTAEYPDKILTSKVEFEPYKGWVVVLFPRKGENLDFLTDRAEVRQPILPEPGFAPEPPRRVMTPSDAAKIQAGQRIAPTEIPPGGREQLPKSALEAEYKQREGKFPPREWKKAELIQILKDLDRKAGK